MNCAICNEEMVSVKLNDGTIKDYWLHCPKPFKEPNLAKYFSHHNYLKTSASHEILIGQFRAEAAEAVEQHNIALIWMNNSSTFEWDYLHQFKYKDFAHVVEHLNKVVKLKAFL